MSVQVQQERVVGLKTGALATLQGASGRTFAARQDVVDRERPRKNLTEIYAHGFLITYEGTTRYQEFADWLECRGDEATCVLFVQFAQRQSRLANRLAKHAPVEQLPQQESWRHGWLGNGPVETEACSFIFHLMGPWHALNIALSAKVAAKEFLEQLALSSIDLEAYALATEMIQAQVKHIKLLEMALNKAPRPVVLDEELGQFPLH